MAESNKISFDTSVYIDHLQGKLDGKRIEPYLSTGFHIIMDEVVLYELYAGARDEAERGAIRQLEEIVDLIPIQEGTFIRAGHIINRMMRDNVISRHNIHRIENDVLIALNSVSIGATLITRDKKDVEKISRYIPLRFILF